MTTKNKIAVTAVLVATVGFVSYFGSAGNLFQGRIALNPTEENQAPNNPTEESQAPQANETTKNSNAYCRKDTWKEWVFPDSMDDMNSTTKVKETFDLISVMTGNGCTIEAKEGDNSEGLKISFKLPTDMEKGKIYGVELKACNVPYFDMCPSFWNSAWDETFYTTKTTSNYQLIQISKDSIYQVSKSFPNQPAFNLRPYFYEVSRNPNYDEIMLNPNYKSEYAKYVKYIEAPGSYATNGSTKHYFKLNVSF